MVTRYVGATLFVDHYYEFTCVHLISKLDSDATFEAKLAFERICDSYGVNTLHYHAYNGIFDTNNFKEACNIEKQTLSFCGVKAHHQNGKSENIIKDLTTGARTDLLHADHLWPNAINASLWPANIKNYFNLRNPLLKTLNLKPTMGGIKYQQPMTLPRYHDYTVLELKQIWNTSILLDPRFMLLKLLFSLVNITTNE